MAIKLNSVKHTLINKAYSTVVIFMTVGVFITVFSLLSAKVLLNQSSYQSRVITEKQKALNNLEQDLQAKTSLVNSYQSLVSSSQNIIGGSTNGSGPRDGDNAKIILDALPSKYDFPALATSVYGLLNGQGASITSFSGTDDQLTQNKTATTISPVPVPMPFSFTISGSSQVIQNVFNAFYQSIRPFDFQTINLSGNQSALNLNATCQTYYQPEKSFVVSSEVVR